MVILVTKSLNKTFIFEEQKSWLKKQQQNLIFSIVKALKEMWFILRMLKMEILEIES